MLVIALMSFYSLMGALKLLCTVGKYTIAKLITKAADYCWVKSGNLEPSLLCVVHDLLTSFWRGTMYAFRPMWPPSALWQDTRKWGIHRECYNQVIQLSCHLTSLWKLDQTYHVNIIQNNTINTIQYDLPTSQLNLQKGPLDQVDWPDRPLTMGIVHKCLNI